MAIIEYQKLYNATWNNNTLNRDELTGTSDIKYELQNWHWFNDQRWRNRNEKQRRNTKPQFDLNSENYTEGFVTFIQTRNQLRFGTFDISLLALNKITASLSILYTSTLFSFMPNVGEGKAGIMQYCRNWFNMTQDKISPTELISCPCNVQTARGDPDFEIDDTCPSSKPKLKCHENVGAETCYIRQISETYVLSVFA